MKLITSKRSPNFSDITIPVQFLVLHYTAASLELSALLQHCCRAEQASAAASGPPPPEQALVTALTRAPAEGGAGARGAALAPGVPGSSWAWKAKAPPLPLPEPPEEEDMGDR